MSNQIIPVLWGKPLRKSEVNTLDKVNELVEFINNSDIHELDLIASDQGREVITGTSTQLAQLEVYGESVQDGTPTPSSPVPVQVVDSRNLFGTLQPGTYTQSGITAIVENDNIVKLSGTATGGGNLIIPLVETVPIIHDGRQVYSHNRNSVANPSIGLTLQPGIEPYNGPNMGAFSPANRIFGLSMDAWNAIDTIGSIRIYIPANLSITDTVICQPSIEYTDTVTPFNPYGISLQIDETIHAIDLQGNVLASLPDGTRDVLRVNSAGVVKDDKRVDVVDLGTLTWAIGGTTTSDIKRMMSNGIISIVKKPGSDSQAANIICDAYVVKTASQTYQKMPGIAIDGTGSISIYDENYNTVDSPAAFKTAMDGVLLYYELATPQTIELGTITPPAIPSGSIVKIVATLQPEFTIAWFTENGLPLAINDMRDYVDAKINDVNARIDELHGITRANLEVQSIPVDDTENESDTEVTENER